MKWLLLVFLTIVTVNVTSEPIYKVSKSTEKQLKVQIDTAIINEVIQIESSNDPYAESTEGARGLMQILPSTAGDYGYTAEQLWNPELNIKCGKRHLKMLMKLFDNDVIKVLASYNCGQGRVKKLIKKHGDNWQEYLPKETKNYLNKLSTVVYTN